MANQANNPLNVPGKAKVWQDSKGNTNNTVGGSHGWDHSHTVIAPNGSVLFDRNANRVVLTGRSEQNPLFPPSAPIPFWKR